MLKVGPLAMFADDRRLTKTEPDSEAPASTKGGWAQYKRKLDRIDAAILCASAVTDDPVAQIDIPANDPSHGKSVNVTFDGDQWFKIPWEACCTWQVRTAITI